MPTGWNSSRCPCELWESSRVLRVVSGVKAGLYRILCVHTLGDSGVHTLGDTSAFVNPAGQLLLTQRVNS